MKCESLRGRSCRFGAGGGLPCRSALENVELWGAEGGKEPSRLKTSPTTNLEEQARRKKRW